MSTKKIAVLGAGGTGHALAGTLSLAGQQVALYEEPMFEVTLKDALRQGGVEITGAGPKGFASVSMITTNMAEALDGASIILVSVLAMRHERIAELCAPCLSDGQTIVIAPGNVGSLVFDKKFREMGVKNRVLIAEKLGNFFPCRLIAPAKVILANYSTEMVLSAFPGRDTSRVISNLEGVFNAKPATNVLEVSLNSPNITSHLLASLLNTGSIEKSGGEYYLYKQGFTPSVLRCIKVLEEEKKLIVNALGYNGVPVYEFLEKVSAYDEYPELEVFRGLIGPTSMGHRYITEDAFAGMSLLVSLGEMLNIPTPLSCALVTLASAINRVDYLKEGRTLRNFGLTELTVDELNEYLSSGGDIL